jgi:hypothetical protein
MCTETTTQTLEITLYPTNKGHFRRHHGQQVFRMFYFEWQASLLSVSAASFKDMEGSTMGTIGLQCTGIELPCSGHPDTTFPKIDSAPQVR